MGNHPIAMKDYLELLPFCIAALTLDVGCSPYPYRAQTPPLSAYRPVPSVPSASAVPAQSAKAKVEIISDPAGARIEVNDNYVGDAPITVEIPEKASAKNGGANLPTKAHSCFRSECRISGV